MEGDRQRLDRWLWHARVARTRTLAAKLATGGHVRLNGKRCDSSSQPVRAGDVLTLALPARIRILKVARFSERRGGASSAQALYEDLTPPPEPTTPRSTHAVREPGSGRPTKRERRANDRLRQDGGRDEP